MIQNTIKRMKTTKTIRNKIGKSSEKVQNSSEKVRKKVRKEFQKSYKKVTKNLLKHFGENSRKVLFSPPAPLNISKLLYF